MTTGEQTPLLYGRNDASKNEPTRGWSVEIEEVARTYAIENDEVAIATSYLRDAILLTSATSVKDVVNQYYFSRLQDASKVSLWSRRILNHQVMKSLVHICALGLVFLSFVEPPAWCRTFDDGDEDHDNGCEIALKKIGVPYFYSNDSEQEFQYYYPNAGTNILSMHQSLAMEIFFVSVLIIHFIISFASYNFSFQSYFVMDAYFNSEEISFLTVKHLKISSIARIIRLGSILSLIIGMYNVTTPLAIFLRMIVFITFSETAMEQFILTSKLVPKLLSVSAVLLLVIFFYGIIGVFLFQNSQEGSEFFSSLIEAMWTLWTSMTSVIYPDVMMSAYNNNRLFGLYFVSYMIFTFFFFLNVILALVFNVYANTVDATKKEIEDAKGNYITQAFKILDKANTGEISHTCVMSIFYTLNKDYKEIRPIPEHDATIMFSLLDQDRSESIDLQEFSNFGKVILVQFDAYSKTTWFEEMFPTFAHTKIYEQISSIIQSDKFDAVIDIAIVCNCIVVFVQFYPTLAGHGEQVVTRGHWEIMELIFTLVYVIEMTAKIVVLGWDKYSSSLRHLFDGFITILALVTMIIVYYPNAFNNRDFIQVVIISRIFRLLRLPMAMEPFQVIGRTFVAILPSAGKMIVLLFCIMYIFSAIGMYFFGGLITRDPANPVSKLLEGTDFADSLYWANNFNDLISGINVIFNLLVINNWNEMESGILAVSETKQSRWFFFTVYIIGVILVNNLVIALSIDTFNNELEYGEQDNNSKRFVFIGKRLLFKPDRLNKGESNMGRYTVARLSTQGKTIREEKKILADLFEDVGYTYTDES